RPGERPLGDQPVGRAVRADRQPHRCQGEGRHGSEAHWADGLRVDCQQHRGGAVAPEARMIVPGEAKKKADRVKWLIDTCRLSHQDRRTLYDRRRGYFLHGTAADKEIIYNRIESHLDLVASFLYSADHANFNLSASLNAPEERVRQFLAAQDEFNEDLRDA